MELLNPLEGLKSNGERAIDDTVSYLLLVSVELRKGNVQKAIEFLNSPRLRPSIIGQNLLNRPLLDSEKPFFFNEVPEYAPIEIREVAVIARRMRNVHQTARMVLRENRVKTERNSKQFERIADDLLDFAGELKEIGA